MSGLLVLALLIFSYGCTSLTVSSANTTVNCINVTCNGVTTCRAPNNIPPCAPIPPTNSTCPSGYVCGIESNGCAAPGQIYNCPNMPVNISSNITANESVNLTEELNSSAKAGFKLTQVMFYANSSSVCSKQLISPCDNNEPSQFICVNQNYATQVSAQHSSIYSSREICPMFYMVGSVTCGLDNNYCVVLDQQQ